MELLFLKIEGEKGKRALVMLCAGNVLLNVLFFAAPYQICGQDMWKAFVPISQLTQMTRNEEKEDIEEGWYRIDCEGSSRSESLIMGYKSCSMYYSTLNRNIWSFYDMMKISSGIRGAVHCLIGLDGRMVLESLLNVKYYEEDGELKENENNLPFGVEYAGAVSEADFAQMNPIEKQDTIIKSIVLADTLETAIIDDSLAVTEMPYSVEYKNMEVEGNILYPHKGAEMVFHMEGEIPSPETGELYLYLKGFQTGMADKEVRVYVNNKVLYVDNPEYVYTTGQKDYLVKVSDGDIAVTLSEENFYTLEEVDLYWYALDGVKENLAALKKHSLTNLCYDNDVIEGDISAIDGYLFLSIPYDPSWKVYVDGVKTQTYRANVGFTAIYLREGKHHVRIEYTADLEKIGGVVAFIAIVILCSLFIMNKKRGKVCQISNC